MFEYSEYMVTVLYNRLCRLSLLEGGKLKLYKVFYDNHAGKYLAVAREDLFLSKENQENFEKEARSCVHLSDMANGKKADVKLNSRLTGK